MEPLDNVRYVRHGTVIFEAENVVVYADPYQMHDAPHDADLIIITHDHADHYSPEDIRRVMREDTCFATTAQVSARLQEDMQVPDDYITQLSCEAPCAAFECGVMVTPVIAENRNHDINRGFGAMVEIAGARYYLSGDTDVLADVACDVLFVCCDGQYNMPETPQQIVNQLQAADHKPGLVVPYHYGVDMPGSENNGAALVDALQQAGINAALWENR